MEIMSGMNFRCRTFFKFFLKCTFSLCGILYLIMSDNALAQGNCPEPIRQVDQNISAEIETKLSAIRRLASGEVQARTERTAVDLLSKFPNADRVALAQNLISVFCNQINQSKTIPDNQKFDLYFRMQESISKIINPGNSGEINPETGNTLRDQGMTGHFTGKAEVSRQTGNFSINIEPSNKEKFVQIQLRAWGGLHGEGTLIGAISSNGQLQATGKFQSFNYVYDCNLTGLIKDNKLNGSFLISPQFGTLMPEQEGRFALQKFVPLIKQP